jgi:ATP-dependent Clp protease adaptor protein ClpS
MIESCDTSDVRCLVRSIHEARVGRAAALMTRCHTEGELRSFTEEPRAMTDFDTGLSGGTDTAQRIDIPWEVILWNDPVSLISLVVRVLKKVFSYSQEKAEQLTMMVHNDGKAVVWTGDKETAAAYCVALHGYALGATIQPSR